MKLTLKEKIEFLLGELTDNLEAWQSVTTGLDTADLYCGVFMDNWNEGFKLSQNLLKKISARHLEVSFDIYSPTDSWYGDNEESQVAE